jgi:hypothetical protein
MTSNLALNGCRVLQRYVHAFTVFKLLNTGILRNPATPRTQEKAIKHELCYVHQNFYGVQAMLLQMYYFHVNCGYPCLNFPMVIINKFGERKDGTRAIFNLDIVQSLDCRYTSERWTWSHVQLLRPLA